MSRIWRYSLVHDNGMAPCATEAMLSLSCCKPMIRRHAKAGEWVVGFVPRRVNGARVHVAWAGQVTEVVPLGEYQKRFSERPDAIYKLVKSEFGGPKTLVPLRDDYHCDQEKAISRSQRGERLDLQNVLVLGRPRNPGPG